MNLQEKKINEMIDNVNKLKEDLKAMKESMDDIEQGQKTINDLLSKLIDAI